ncbi:uncharacterized protein LOC143857837 [Tasmannia lanceolata]|uniref:uncharacterized protein LOC143857837 n=1 Tax=Tasmannia lanceolata TaxID=3420 RepID=UPI004063571E
MITEILEQENSTVIPTEKTMEPENSKAVSNENSTSPEAVSGEEVGSGEEAEAVSGEEAASIEEVASGEAAEAAFGEEVASGEAAEAASGEAAEAASGEEVASGEAAEAASGEAAEVALGEAALVVKTKKKKRGIAEISDPEVEVIALSPKTLMSSAKFVCDVCNKEFQRDQNLQLHRRGHNLPWKLQPKSNKEVRKRVYVCPETSCIHHDPSRALGDISGIKKHYCRKHGVKKWKCEKCSKEYAVKTDWKAHCKTCGPRGYRCNCGTLFSRKDSFISHRDFCEILAEEKAKAAALENSTLEQDPKLKKAAASSAVVVSAVLPIQQIAPPITITASSQQWQQQSTTLMTPTEVVGQHQPPWRQYAAAAKQRWQQRRRRQASS